MKQINPNVYPHGGYFFKETDGTSHAADSWAGVIARVKTYRKRQGKPAGNAEAEVIFQACSRHPVLCVEDNGVTQAQQVRVSLKGRVLQWLMSIRKAKKADQVHIVSRDLHEARTDVCIRCPLDKGMADSGCGSCRAALKELKSSIVGGRETDARISVCPALGEYLPVSTWLDLQTTNDSELPAGECWRKRTL